ncbi:MAG: 2-C-methyl-D-erythritol 4-phosphate cytidylyltransferase [Desulfobacterota bacterium]|nr:2-C-methyl-D-erythritol 4-phosphate cytidylyltransferase [Thermodesulfobacteriota bacterium]
MKTAAIITAAGAGVRMGGDQAKQFMDLGGRPLLAVTLGCFERSPDIDGIVLVVPPGKADSCRDEIVEKFGLGKVVNVVSGGKRRQDSVRLGLEATEGRYALVLIHDGVRPLVPPDLVSRIVKAMGRYRAVIPAMAARETIKEADRAGLVVKTHDRSALWLVQTPQAFRYEDILKAHRRAFEEKWEEMTDDALLMERTGVPVHIIEGAEENIKITTPRDLELARFLFGRMP